VLTGVCGAVPQDLPAVLVVVESSYYFTSSYFASYLGLLLPRSTRSFLIDTGMPLVAVEEERDSNAPPVNPLRSRTDCRGWSLSLSLSLSLSSLATVRLFFGPKRASMCRYDGIFGGFQRVASTLVASIPSRDE